MNTVKVLALMSVSLLVSACNSDDDSSKGTSVQEPTSYLFMRDGSSTVSFNGQSTRILMANELLDKFTDFENVTAPQLLSMYNHQSGVSDFSDADLNASGKNIRSKIASSADYFASNSVSSEAIKSLFEEWIENQANSVAPNYMTLAAPGVAGQVIVGEKTRYVNEKGIENNQMFAKSLIGALLADQALNNYLSQTVLDAGDNRINNSNKIVLEGKSYTMMEHKWDEAYGYIYGGEVENEANPNASSSAHNNFLHKYSLKVDENANFSGIANDIFNAFKKGRYAIVTNDYDLRDAQIKIVKEKVSTVIAVRAIHYLQSGKAKIAQGERKAAFHDLSEGLGFLYSLQFTQNPNTGAPYMSAEEVDVTLQSILANNGLWTVEPATLDQVSEAIASKSNFTVAQAAL